MKQTDEMMNDREEMKMNGGTPNERLDKEILFSKSVKAGKRVYYFDVKKDRRDAYYVSITESKRLKEGTFEERPVFEKHKIFLYREDIEKFMEALTSATSYAVEHSPNTNNFGHYGEQPENELAAVDREDEEAFGSLNGNQIKLDLDF